MQSVCNGIVNLQGVGRSLPWSCTSRLTPTSCFFPQHMIETAKTPLFLVNAAYDTWQVLDSLVPPSADPWGNWNQCRKNYARCAHWQISFFQGFRRQMLSDIRGFPGSSRNGYFINSCLAHCQTEVQGTWFVPNSPRIGNEGIAESVGNWYFDRGIIREIDCTYPWDNSCHNLVFQ